MKTTRPDPSARLAEVEARFKVKLPAALRAAWQRSMEQGGAPTHFFDLGAGIEPLVAMARQMAEMNHVEPHPSRELHFLPFAEPDPEPGAADVAEPLGLALDLRIPPDEVGDFVVVRHHVLKEPPVVHLEYDSSASWLKHRRKPRARSSAEPLPELTPPEEVSVPQRQRLEQVQARMLAKGLPQNPPLHEAEVDRFEQQHHARLPWGYREYLLRIGDGGAGPPAQGLRRLTPAPLLHKPFPFAKARLWEGAANQSSLIRRSIRGRLRLGDHGCAQEWLLVVTGKQRGKIWLHSEVGVVPWSQGGDFLDWIELWLDEGDEGGRP